MTIEENNSPPNNESQTPEEIIANRDWRYRWKHLAFAILIVAGGLWFMYDGYIGWPNKNKKFDEVFTAKEQAQEAGESERVAELAEELQKLRRYTETDILIQKLLGWSLPFVGIAYGIWTLWATRGRYHYRDGLISAPGASDVPLADIRQIDRRRWDRKGIAIIHYERHNPRRMRSFRLDDFAYERKPTDQIFDILSAYLAPPEMTGSQRQSEPEDSAQVPAEEKRETESQS